MPDPIAAAFQPDWYLAADPTKAHKPTLVGVMLCQEAWRRLTVRSQRALLAIAEKPGHQVHYSTRLCLIRRRLINESNEITDAGRAVVRHRPRKTDLPHRPRKTDLPHRIAGRPVIDVHLPPLPAEVTA